MEGDRQDEDNEAQRPAEFFVDKENLTPLGEKRTRKEKTIVGAAVVVAMVAIFFGFWQMHRGISRPFLAVSKNTNQGEECLGGDCELQKKLAVAVGLKRQDTDGDGLSDYDESYVYKTSPYLEDSDSDGLSDKTEADNGTDPNCPGQESCFAPTGSGTNTNASIDNNANMSGAAGSQAALAAQFNQLGGQKIRQLLLANGASADDLSQISDEELMATYEQLAAEKANGNQTQISDLNVSSSSALTAQTGSGVTTINSAADLQNVTGAQLREMMIESGAPADLLGQVTDEQLKQMFLQKLQEKTGQ